MPLAARYDEEGGTGWDTFSGEEVRMTASQHWDGHQKAEERDAGQRQLGEGQWKRKETRQGGQAGR